MLVTVGHAKLLERIGEKREHGLPLDKVIDELTDRELAMLDHLIIQGLVDEDDDKFTLTTLGSMLLEVWLDVTKNLAKPFFNPDEVGDNFRWIGSEIISLIEAGMQAQTNLEGAADYFRELEKRGFMLHGHISPYAQTVLNIYERMNIKLNLSPELCAYLRKTPPGPGKKSLLNFIPDLDLWTLEAQRILTFSLPYGNFYSLTGPGQQIRAALIKGSVFPFPLTEELIANMLYEPIPKAALPQLQAVGAVDELGNILPAGEHLKKAAQLLRTPITVAPSMDLDELDLDVLFLIKEIEEKEKSNPEFKPTYKNLRKHIESKGRKETPKKTEYSLYQLEGFNLITAEIEEKKGEIVYRFTDYGQEVYEDQKAKRKVVHADAVSAITMTRMAHTSPADDWILRAEQDSLVGGGAPTASGRLYAKIASTAPRIPVLTDLEVRVLRKIPLWRGVFKNTILAEFPEKDHDEVKLGLRKLVAQGLLIILPGEVYKLSEVGEKIKQAVAGVPSGISFPVSPKIVQVLLAVKKLNETMRKGKNTDEFTADEIEFGSGLSLVDTGTFSDLLVVARKCNYIKSGKLTSAGELLLEAVKDMKYLKTNWLEILV